MEDQLKNAPNYSEMLLLGEEDFEKWLVRWIDSPQRDILLSQMVEHESRTHSFANSVRPEEITPSMKSMLSLFIPEESAHTKDIFQRTWKETGVDLIKHAMMAKSANDWALQKNKIK